jgi:hypothetical protein
MILNDELEMMRLEAAVDEFKVLFQRGQFITHASVIIKDKMLSILML